MDRPERMAPRSSEARSAARVASSDVVAPLPLLRRPSTGFVAICLGYFAIILDGSVLNVAVPAIRADFRGSLAGAQWVLNAYTLTLAGLLLTAGALGDRIGLHPLAVIFALLAFGEVFGFAGVLMALPVSAMLLVGLRHLRRAYVESPVYRDD